MTNDDLTRGHCACGAAAFEFSEKPLIVHCCHCTWCQRETGTAFAQNALIETETISVIAGAPEKTRVPSASGKGQTLVGCGECHTVLWSHYSGMGEKIAFVRVGSLENPGRFPPDVHIFVQSKQPWVIIPAGARSFQEYYQWRDVWREDAKARRLRLR